MARIIYPVTPEARVELGKNIRDKHLADGATSVLSPFFIEQGIDVNAHTQATLDSIAFYQEGTRLGDASTDMTQDRNNLFDPVFANYLLGAQFLKKHYKGNVRELVKWRIPVDNNGQINYPSDFVQRTDLVLKLYAYHASLGAGSPLTLFLTNNNIVPSAETANTASAQAKNTLMLKTKKDAEKNMEKARVLFDPVWRDILKTGGYLKSVFPKTPKRLGDWGFVVDDSPRPPRERSIAILANTTKTISGIKLGSILTNTGAVELHIYKGKGIKGETIKLAPEDTFTILRGWGTTTVQNKDKKVAGEVTYISVSGA